MTDKRITSNQRYNAERKAQAELMKRDLDRDKVLAQIYQESFDRMQREIDDFYMRYARREGLTKQEAMKKAGQNKLKYLSLFSFFYSSVCFFVD